MGQDEFGQNGRLDKIHSRFRAMNQKIDELELMGYQVDGWNSKTDKMTIVKPGKQETDNVIVGYLDRQLNVEWVYKVFDAVSAEEEAKAFQRQTGWHMLWLDEGFRKIEKCVVYRSAEDLPEDIREFAKAMEPLEEAPMVYHLDEWGLEGTADELFLMVRNCYKYLSGELPIGALWKIQQILSSNGEKKEDKAFYVGVLIEIAEGNPEDRIGDYYSLPEVKRDILDSMKLGRCSIYVSPENGMTLLIELQGREVLLDLTDKYGEDVGSKRVSVDDFLRMDNVGFRETVDIMQGKTLQGKQLENLELDWEAQTLLDVILADAELRSHDIESGQEFVYLEK